MRAFAIVPVLLLLLLPSARAVAQQPSAHTAALRDAGIPLTQSPAASPAPGVTPPVPLAASVAAPGPGGSGAAAPGIGLPSIPNPLDLLAAIDPREWAVDILDGVISALGEALLGALHGFVDWALGFEDSALNFVTSTPPAGTYESTSVRALWDFSRVLANAGLAVIVMWGSFNVVVKEHIRSPYHEAMELLPRVLLAALAANLTLELVRLLIDLNNAFGVAIGQVSIPGYDEATAEQEGLAFIILTVAYTITVVLLSLQMLLRLALIDVLIVLAPVVILLWVLPQTQGWTRWWAHLLPITVFQQAVQLLVLRLGTMLMAELTPGSMANAALTLMVGGAVVWLTLKVPGLLHGQWRQAGMGAVVSLVVLHRLASGGQHRARTASGS